MNNLCKKQKSIDEIYINFACNLSSKSVSNDEMPFGCVIVHKKTGIIIGRGYNKVIKTCDPTAHAEIVAIRDACKTLNKQVLNECILYSVCEPCQMCLSAINITKIPKVFYSNSIKDIINMGININDLPINEETNHYNNINNFELTQITYPNAIKIFEEWKQKQQK